jgi:outer membrane protein assembly factor BamA
MSIRPKINICTPKKKDTTHKAPCALSFVILGILLCSLSLFAEDKVEEKKKKDRSIFVLPVAYYSPETKLALGAGGGYFFRTSKDDPTLRPSSINTFIVYTLNKQFQMFVSPDIYLRKNEYRIQSSLAYSYFNDKFYGIGPDTTEDMEENYVFQSFLMNVNVQKKAFAHLNAGVRYDFGYQKLVDVDEEGLLITGEIPGSSGGNISGLGLLLSWDSRDSIYYSREGSYHQLFVTFYHQALGSDFHFTKYLFDLRKYIPLFESHSIALQGYFSFTTGDVPFQLLPLMGGPQLMRGYYTGRYRDKNMVVLQMEYRVQLIGRFGIVGFAGFGDVADRLSQFDFAKLKHSLGLGLRYTFNREEKINLRLDMGFTGEGRGLYFSATEAF